MNSCKHKNSFVYKYPYTQAYKPANIKCIKATDTLIDTLVKINDTSTALKYARTNHYVLTAKENKYNQGGIEVGEGTEKLAFVMYHNILAEGEGPHVPDIEDTEKLARKVMVRTYVLTYLNKYICKN